MSQIALQKIFCCIAALLHCCIKEFHIQCEVMKEVYIYYYIYYNIYNNIYILCLFGMPYRKILNAAMQQCNILRFVPQLARANEALAEGKSRGCPV